MKQKRSSLFRLLSMYKGYKKDIILIVLGAMAGVVTNLLYPYVSKYAIEKVVYMGLQEALPVLFWIAIILIVLIIGDIFSTRVYQYTSSVLYGHIMEDMKESLYRKLHRLSASFYDDTHSGKLITIIDDDADNSSHLLSDILPFLVSSSIQLVGGIVVFYNISPIMTLCISPLLIILMVFNIWVIPKMRSSIASIRSIVSEQMAVAGDAMSGIRTTQAYGMEEYEINKFMQYQYKSTELIKHKWNLIFLHLATSNTLTSIIYGVFIVAGTILTIQGKMKLTDMTLFYMYFHIITNPMEMIRSMSKEIGKCFASFEKITEILDTPEDIYNNPNGIEANIKGDIEFNHVSFKYKKSNELIKDMSFKINRGEKIAIVGESGSGKSTLAGLIPRYYNVSKGSILVDGININLYNLHKLRRSIGFISQEPFLYNISILDNIRYGCPWATREEVVEAAKKAKAHKFIFTLPDGYDSKVGERGVKLSGGQKQRIAIARLFLLNPPIMIFDEATSALDSVQEKKVQKALNELAKGRTCITIAHRLSTIADSDRIFVMESGSIVEIGTHEELMEIPDGVYQKLYNTQYKL